MTARLKPALIVLVAACRAAPVGPCPSTRVAGMAAEQAAPVARPSPFDSVFQAAGAEFDVPPALLKATGWVETRWQMVEGREEFTGRPPQRGAHRPIPAAHRTTRPLCGGHHPTSTSDRPTRRARSTW